MNNRAASPVNGEGTFDVKIYKSNTKTGYAVQLRFRIPQHERDTNLIELLQNYFGSGVLEKHTLRTPSSCKFGNSKIFRCY